MRIALLGPSEGDVPALARAAATALKKLAADRIVYLGVDGAIDAVVLGWARLLGAAPPLSQRVGALLAKGDARAFADEVVRERARRELDRLRALPGKGVRSIELLGDRIVLLVDDKTDLDEEDLLPASLIVFGVGDATIRRVGTRTFLCPGSPKHKDQGIVLLDEGEAGATTIAASVLDADGVVVQRESIELARAAKVRVHGAA